MFKSTSYSKRWHNRAVMDALLYDPICRGRPNSKRFSEYRENALACGRCIDDLFFKILFLRISGLYKEKVYENNM